MAKVAFDGTNRLITINTGITEIDFTEDVYSEWKLWVLVSDNAKYTQAISVIGGDPIGGSRYLGATFFLENNWKIRPYEGNHTLTITGNVYSRDGSSPLTATIGNYNVLVNMSTSNLIDTIATGGSDAPTAEENATAVWNKILPETPVASSYGEWVSAHLLTLAQFLGLK